jgi:threonine aldolase
MQERCAVPDKQGLVREATRIIRSAKYLTAFTGAGISVESGIPPFRGPGGLWSKYDPRMLELDYFLAHPERSWPVIKEIFYDNFGAARPNKAHLALARLELEGWPREAVGGPSGAALDARGYLKTLITQNIDNLHWIAGSRNIVEFHGNSAYLVCLTCKTRVVATPALLLNVPPRCPCGGIYKPDFIFFGEGIPAEAHSKAHEAARQSDVMLVVGSTGEVYPAALVPSVGIRGRREDHRDKPRRIGIHRFGDDPSPLTPGRGGIRPDRKGALPMKIFDLRSDTVTRPSPGMRKAMAEAEVGDDVYGEDPTVNALQDLAARTTGKEAALFVSTGSMGNLIPIYLNCGAGNEMLISSRGHSVQHELAGVSAIAGSLPIMIPSERGILTPELLEPWIQPDAYDHARTRMIVLENTHNAAGGTVYPLAAVQSIGAFARKKKLAVHIDGARLFNALVASGVDAPSICREADTVTFCLSKGLGAPVGSLLCGTRDFISEARRVRKMLGGGMRQAGIIAAAGMYALSHNIQRLAEDHQNAKLIARALAGTTWAALDPNNVVTNILYFRTPGRNAAEVMKSLARQGILCWDTAADQVRFVTHLDISTDDTREIVQLLEKMKI